jgi:hypothetical protein
MTDTEKYKSIAAELRFRARSERSAHVKAELESLAECYLLMAERNGRNSDAIGIVTAI